MTNNLTFGKRNNGTPSILFAKQSRVLLGTLGVGSLVALCRMPAWLQPLDQQKQATAVADAGRAAGAAGYVLFALLSDCPIQILSRCR